LWLQWHYEPHAVSKFMIRLDQALVERGLCDSREKAKRAILAGRFGLYTQIKGENL